MKIFLPLNIFSFTTPINEKNNFLRMDESLNDPAQQYSYASDKPYV